MTKTVQSLYTTLFLCLALLLLSGCEEKKSQEERPQSEEIQERQTVSTEGLSQEELNQIMQRARAAIDNVPNITISSPKSSVVIEKNSTTLPKLIVTAKTNPTPLPEQTDAVTTAVQKPLKNNFLLKSDKGVEYNISIKSKQIQSATLKKPLLLFYFFRDSCHSCLGMSSYLSDLQKKYKKELTIIAIDLQHTHSSQKEQSTATMNYFVSNTNTQENHAIAHAIAHTLALPKAFSLPLTILYHEGRYYTDYEGAVPVEMIDHDIRKAIKK